MGWIVLFLLILVVGSLSSPTRVSRRRNRTTGPTRKAHASPTQRSSDPTRDRSSAAIATAKFPVVSHFKSPDDWLEEEISRAKAYRQVRLVEATELAENVRESLPELAASEIALDPTEIAPECPTTERVRHHSDSRPSDLNTHSLKSAELKPPFELVLLDLDETLLRSDDLKEFRGRDQSLYDTPDEYCQRLRDKAIRLERRLLIDEKDLNQLREHNPALRLGLFTTSLRRYAEALLSVYYPQTKWDVKHDDLTDLMTVRGR